MTTRLPGYARKWPAFSTQVRYLDFWISLPGSVPRIRSTGKPSGNGRNTNPGEVSRIDSRFRYRRSAPAREHKLCFKGTVLRKVIYRKRDFLKRSTDDPDGPSSVGKTQQSSAHNCHNERSFFRVGHTVNGSYNNRQNYAHDTCSLPPPLPLTLYTSVDKTRGEDRIDGKQHRFRRN